MSKTSKFNGNCVHISFNEPHVAGQNINSTLLFRVKASGNKYRIVLRKNAYKEQSYGRLQAWTNESGWETIETSNPYDRTEYWYGSRIEIPGDAFDEVYRELMRVAVDFDS